MKLSKAVLSALGSVAMSGCINAVTGGGCPEPAAFTLTSEIVTQDDLATAADYHGKAVEDLSCDEICGAVVGGPSTQSVLVSDCTFLEGDLAPPEAAGQASVTCSGTTTAACLGGRRPMGHVAFAAHVGDLGRYYAGCAYMEMASIRAFLELGKQLSGWGAPESLVSRCRAAAEDELRHAQIFYRLAAEERCKPPTPRQEPASEDLFAVALHNAVEGCVNESWAALLAHYQSRHAPSERLRMVFAQVAADETRHGQLAWDLHAWFLTQLSPAQRQTLALAQAEAIEALSQCAPEPVWAPTCVGLPQYDTMQQLAISFGAELARA